MAEKSQRWLCDVLVESSLILPDGIEVLEHNYPESSCQVFIRRVSDEVEQNEQLSIQIILEASDMNQAEEVADEELDKFLRLLSFVTSSPYRLSRKLYLIDWTPGKSMRDVWVYKEQPHENAWKALHPGLMNTIETLQTWGIPKFLERAVRWYASGVRAKILEDQYQYFFFAIELLAAEIEKVGPVPDKCQKCGSDLFCKTCNEVPTHQPFAAQAIQMLFERVGVDGQTSEQFFKVRHALMHGRDRFDIENSLKKLDTEASFHDLVDKIGRVAWVGILNAFQKPPGKHRPEFLEVSTFVNWTATLKVHMQVGMPGDPNGPKYEDITLPTVSLEIAERD